MLRVLAEDRTKNLLLLPSCGLWLLTTAIVRPSLFHIPQTGGRGRDRQAMHLRGGGNYS